MTFAAAGATDTSGAPTLNPFTRAGYTEMPTGTANSNTPT